MIQIHFLTFDGSKNSLKEIRPCTPVLLKLHWKSEDSNLLTILRTASLAFDPPTKLSSDL